MPPLTLCIVTPESTAWEGAVDSVAAPAADGELGILPGHAALLAQLAPGVLRFRHGEAEELFAVSGGFLEVFQDRVNVLAETAELAAEIDAERARQAVERAKTQLTAGDLETVEEAEKTIKRALVRLRVAGMARRRSVPRDPRLD